MLHGMGEALASYSAEGGLSLGTVQTRSELPECLQPPQSKLAQSHLYTDFLILTEFTEDVGPVPLRDYIIPDRKEIEKDRKFDLDEFSIRIMSADYFAQAQSQDRTFRMPEDIHALISNSQSQCYTLLYAFTLYDMEARGYVRPLYLAYTSSDRDKIVNIYDSFRQSIAKAVHRLVHCNIRMFAEELERYNNSQLPHVEEDSKKQAYVDVVHETVHRKLRTLDYCCSVKPTPLEHIDRDNATEKKQSEPSLRLVTDISSYWDEFRQDLRSLHETYSRSYSQIIQAVREEFLARDRFTCSDCLNIGGATLASLKFYNDSQPSYTSENSHGHKGSIISIGSMQSGSNTLSSLSSSPTNRFNSERSSLTSIDYSSLTSDPGVNSLCSDLGFNSLTSDHGASSLTSDPGVNSVTSDPGIHSQTSDIGLQSLNSDSGAAHSDSDVDGIDRKMSDILGARGAELEFTSSMPSRELSVSVERTLTASERVDRVISRTTSPNFYSPQISRSTSAGSLWSRDEEDAYLPQEVRPRSSSRGAQTTYPLLNSECLLYPELKSLISNHREHVKDLMYSVMTCRPVVLVELVNSRTKGPTHESVASALVSFLPHQNRLGNGYGYHVVKEEISLRSICIQPITCLVLSTKAVKISDNIKAYASIYHINNKSYEGLSYTGMKKGSGSKKSRGLLDLFVRRKKHLLSYYPFLVRSFLIELSTKAHLLHALLQKADKPAQKDLRERLGLHNNSDLNIVKNLVHVVLKQQYTSSQGMKEEDISAMSLMLTFT